jgi:hypothetical protein
MVTDAQESKKRAMLECDRTIIANGGPFKEDQWKLD